MQRSYGRRRKLRRAHADALGNIRAVRVDVHGAVARIHDEIHVLERYGAEQDLLAAHEGADAAGAVFEANDDRAGLGASDPRSVRQLDLSLLEDFKLELQADMLGDAKKDRARVGERSGFDRSEGWLARIAQREFGGHESHASKYSTRLSTEDSPVSGEIRRILGCFHGVQTMTRFSLVISDDLKAKLDDEAERAGVTRSELARVAIAEYVERNTRERYIAAFVAEATAAYANPQIRADALAMAEESLH